MTLLLLLMPLLQEGTQPHVHTALQLGDTQTKQFTQRHFPGKTGDELIPGCHTSVWKHQSISEDKGYEIW